MKSLMLVFFVLTASFGMDIHQSFARETVTFGPRETKIEGSIKYTVLGRYISHFNSFKGRITLDERSQQVQSVYLNIEAGSIQSNHPWFDKMARSRRLLYTRRY